MYKWFLASRYLYTKLIAVFGMLSVMLCVAMVLVVLSVMGGFLDTVRERARGLHSEIVVDGGSLQGFPYYEEFGTYLKAEMPDVVEVTTPVIISWGLLQVPATQKTKALQVFGVRLADYVKVNTFGDGLHYERFYPKTTHLGPQGMPVAGVDADGFMSLPADLESANEIWRGAEPDRTAVEAYLADPFDRAVYPSPLAAMLGERVFAVDLDPPHYAGPQRPGIIIGADVLFWRRADGNFDRHLARGAAIVLTLMPLSPSGNPLGEVPAKIPLRYADDSRTGIYEIDSKCAYIDFDTIQHRLAMDPQRRVAGGMTRARASQLLIGTAEGVDLNEARDSIRAAWDRFCLDREDRLVDDEAYSLSRVKVFTWEDMQAGFIAAVEKEKVLVTFLFSVISMVAIVLLGCIFYMIVEKKTRDIGVLKSIGASNAGVASMFIVYAAAVGLVGSVLGTAVGSTVVWYINDIQDFLATLHPQLRVWSPEVYSFDKIPNVVKRADAIWIMSVAVLSSMVGSLIPAWIASRVWPVHALRYE